MYKQAAERYWFPRLRDRNWHLFTCFINSEKNPEGRFTLKEIAHVIGISKNNAWRILDMIIQFFIRNRFDILSNVPAGKLHCILEKDETQQLVKSLVDRCLKEKPHYPEIKKLQEAIYGKEVATALKFA